MYMGSNEVMFLCCLVEKRNLTSDRLYLQVYLIHLTTLKPYFHYAIPFF